MIFDHEMFHSTPVRNLWEILRDGLRTDITDGRGASAYPGVYLGEEPFADFIAGLYREPVITIAVNVEGLVLMEGEDSDPDRPEWVAMDPIPPERLMPLWGVTTP